MIILCDNDSSDYEKNHGIIVNKELIDYIYNTFKDLITWDDYIGGIYWDTLYKRYKKDMIKNGCSEEYLNMINKQLEHEVVYVRDWE